MITCSLRYIVRSYYVLQMFMYLELNTWNYRFQIAQLDVYTVVTSVSRLTLWTIANCRYFVHAKVRFACRDRNQPHREYDIPSQSRLQAELRLVPRNYDFLVPSTLDRYHFLVLIP